MRTFMNDSERQQAVLDSLEYLTVLNFASARYALNLRWLAQSKRKVVRLLDFDLICASLQPLGIARWIHETQIAPEKQGVANLIGPWCKRRLKSAAGGARKVRHLPGAKGTGFCGSGQAPLMFAAR